MKVTKYLLLILISLGCSLSVAGRPVSIRIGSYNLRMQQLDKGENDWSVRKSRVMQSIEDNAFDVFGLQELTEFAQDDLREALGKKYQFIFFSPYSQDGVGGRAQGIAFDRKRFKLVEYHYFWPSDTPEVMNVNDHHAGHTYKRGAACCVLADRKNHGKKIFVMNCHAPLGREDHFNSSHVYVDVEKKYNPDGLPSFFVGDFNARPDHPSTLYFQTYWKDSAITRGCADKSTFNSFSTDPSAWDVECRRIDYIYYRNIGDPVKYECNRTLYDALPASDHFPVWADFVY